MLQLPISKLKNQARNLFQRKTNVFLTIILVLTICATFIFFGSSNTGLTRVVVNGHGPSDNGFGHEQCRSNLEDFKLDQGNNMEVVFTVSNFAYGSYVLDWVYRTKITMKKDVVILALDESTAGMLESAGYGSVCYYPPIVALETLHSSASWGSTSFRKIGFLKMATALELLNLGFSVLVSEIDVLWYSDPVPYLKNKTEYGSDILSQGLWNTQPANMRNIGFFYLPYREKVMEVMSEVVAILKNDSKAWDQGVFNTVVANYTLNGEIVFEMLDTENFGFEDFFFSPREKLPIVAHLVGLDSPAVKAYVLREKLISGNVNDRIDAKDRFLYYENTESDRLKQVDNLKKGLFLGKLLDRVLILPTFNCSQSPIIRLPSCTAERIVDVTSFERYWVLEHSYLSTFTRDMYGNYSDCDIRNVDQKHQVVSFDDMDCFELKDLRSSIFQKASDKSYLESAVNFVQSVQSMKSCADQKYSGEFLGYGEYCR